MGPKSGGSVEWPLPFRPAVCPIPRFSVVRITRGDAATGASAEDSSASGGGRHDPYLRLIFRRLVAEIRPQAALRLFDGDALPCRVVLDLVAAEPPDREVARLGMREVDAAHARSRRHRVGLGQREPGLLCAEEPEQLRLLAVVRAGGIPERGADPAEPLGDQLLARKLRAR